MYRQSLAPYTIAAGWTAEEPVLSDGYTAAADGTGRTARAPDLRRVRLRLEGHTAPGHTPVPQGCGPVLRRRRVRGPHPPEPSERRRLGTRDPDRGAGRGRLRRVLPQARAGPSRPPLPVVQLERRHAADPRQGPRRHAERPRPLRAAPRQVSAPHAVGVGRRRLELAPRRRRRPRGSRRTAGGVAAGGAPVRAGIVRTPRRVDVASPARVGNQLTAIDLFEGRRGWAVGTHGTILRTTDGGRHWTPQDAGTTVDLFGVAATDETTAWIVGQDGHRPAHPRRRRDLACPGVGVHRHAVRRGGALPAARVDRRRPRHRAAHARRRTHMGEGNTPSPEKASTP